VFLPAYCTGSQSGTNFIMPGRLNTLPWLSSALWDAASKTHLIMPTISSTLTRLTQFFLTALK
jgi:hypothetical protein